MHVDVCCVVMRVTRWCISDKMLGSSRLHCWGWRLETAEEVSVIEINAKVASAYRRPRFLTSLIGDTVISGVLPILCSLSVRNDQL